MNLLANIAEERPLSVMLARDPEVLRTMLNFYSHLEAKVLDVTANERRMWHGVNWPSVTYADIDPAMNPDIVQDFCAMTVADASFDVIVFDPPHLPAAAASKESDQRFVGNYGLGHAPKGDNISGYFPPFLAEAHRVLRPEGLIFAKIKDFVHNHAYQWTLTDFIAPARAMAREDDEEFGEGAWDFYRGLAFVALRAAVGDDKNQPAPQPPESI